MSSAKTIQIMAPAASPNPTGKNGSNTSTNRNAGRAMSGWGRLVKTLHPAAFQSGVPRGTSTRLMASPSGMLWTAIAAVMKTPRSCPPPKETPTPTPSANECAVMTPRMSRAFRASAPASSATSRGPCRSITVLASTIRPNPTRTPRSARRSLSADPSTMRLWLAASMSPPATALKMPSHQLPTSRTKRKGSTPSPVATAVRNAAKTTTQTLSSGMGSRTDGQRMFAVRSPSVPGYTP